MQQDILRADFLKSLNASKKNTRKLGPSILTFSALSACGGSIEPSNDNRENESENSFILPSLDHTISLQYFSDDSERGVVRYFYPRDLDSTAGQEIVLAGFETQPNTSIEYSNTALFILDIGTGSIEDITSSVLMGGSSYVEGVGDLVWGDFNNDGRLDFLTTAYTDMDFSVYTYSFLGTASGFERYQIDSATWQHGASAYDINGDDYDDVYVAGYSGASLYFGSEFGLKEFTTLGDWGGGSGVVLGDFLNNERIQAIVVDAGVVGSNVSDTVLYEISVNEANETVTLTSIGALPAPLLEGPAFDGVLNVNNERSHDVRVEAIDFNNDGLLDVVVFSRSAYDNDQGGWPRVSQVQFLKNEGGGVFSDVTSTVLPNFNYNSNVGYEPVFDDFNKDGFLDIFMSDADFGSSHTSSVFLLGSDSGSFSEFGRDQLTALIPANGGMATVAKDANEEFWLIIGSQSVGTYGRQENLTLYSIDFV